jgi:hypothetical protein
MKTIVIMKNGVTYTHPNCFPDIQPGIHPEVLVIPEDTQEPVLECNLSQIVSVTFEA